MSKKKIAIQSRFEGFDPDQAAADLTSGPRSFSLEDAKQKPKRTPGRTGKDRVKFTTMLRPDLRDLLDTVAANKNMSIADVIEVVILENLNKK